MFILPVQRDDGHFIVVGQFKGQTTLITHLEDYKRSAEAAEPYLAITVHDELIKTKDIALVRGDFEPAKLRKVPDLNNPRSCAACLKIAWPASLVNFYTSDPARAWALCVGPCPQAETARLLKDVFRVYFDTAEYKHLEALNARPAAFDWEAFVRAQLARPAGPAS